MPKPKVPYTKKDYLKIIDRFAGGEKLYKIFKEKGTVSSRHFYREVMKDNELWQQYTRARKTYALQFDNEIEELKDKVEEERISYNQARVLIDTVKWQAAKFYPKMFGDKQEIDITSKGDKINAISNLSTDELLKRAEAVKKIEEKED